MQKKYGQKVHFCPQCRANVFPAPRANKWERKKCGACGSQLLKLTPAQKRRREQTEHQALVDRHRQIRKDRLRKWEDVTDELDFAANLRPGDLEN